MAAPPPSPPSTLARRVNLIEALTEQHDGRCAVSDDAAETMSEQEIRAAFSAVTEVSAAPPPAAAAPALTLPPEPDAAAFRAWFPRAAQTAPGSSSSSFRPVVLTFPPAGCSEDVYTYTGGGAGKGGDGGGNPLLEWCRAHGADLLAAQPPGRGARLREPAPRDLRAYAEQIAPLVARRVAQAPWWAVVGHSKGSWAAVECLRALDRLSPSHHRRRPPLRLMVVGAMPPPDWPEDQRPWRRQRDLDDAAFRDECRGWDVSPQLLDGGEAGGAMWQLFEPALRADFRLFDEYEHEEEGEGRQQEGVRPRRVLAFWGARDRRVTQAMVEAWRAWASSSSFSVQRVDGHHLWPLEWRQAGGCGDADGQREDPRVAWLRSIAEALEEAAADNDGGRD